MAYHTSLFSHCQSSMDLESFGVTDSVMELPFFFDTTSRSGYLEDAIADWKYGFEQQQVLPHSPDRMNSHNLGDQVDPLLNFTSMAAYSSLSETNAGGAEQEAIHSCAKSSLQKGAMSKSSHGIASSFPKKKIAYPFDVVKPGGVEGDVTLKDINHRILMRPKRPIPHPVGDYAAHPCASPASGFGISGKSVVALTKIHTQGGGTITIVRTKS
ncbi:protein XRI1-like isoform X2 [Vitis riparia]|uniref:protein XRI1-like isoform X2 n=1 Tax=Vitis riparia TaxID=96939 RepID=UPI00155B1EB5|nr:protein XRI1-like isoform X2 [Vitis riparia]